MSTIQDLAASVHELTESLRTSTNDPRDQIRLLCSLAEYGTDTSLPRGEDPVGIAGFRNAGPSDIWANTQRGSVGTYLDANGVMRTMPAKTVRPIFGNGLVTGYLDEPASTNLQISSTAISLGTSIYSTGGNTVDLGFVTAPDGTQTARRLRSGPSGPANVYVSRWTLLSVLPSTTYTVSLYLRKNAGTLSVATGLTVDEYNSSAVVLVRNGNRSLVSATGEWTRFTRTFTTRSDAATIMVYYADNWTVGAELDVWGFQIEEGSTATSLIYTPVGSGASRAADNIQLLTRPVLSQIAKAQAVAQESIEALCRRAALGSLALAVSDYTPASSNEASATLRRILPLYDAEILNAGDIGDMDTYNELRSLRSAVAADLQRRGVQLPEIIEVTRAESQPGLVLAHALYEDARRGDELVQRVNCPHPLFFPKKFEALGS